ncbi:unnamed protein product [Adineta steineri]|uniref:Archaemetzincin-2 n=1 Tax=Adineta steineri TaxID=433720 RepID=A0A818SZP4_9BILA|nr:unnamed protein product [Adineta steineri]
MAMHRQKKKFVPPTKKQRADALGEINDLDEDIRRALTITIDECFPSIPIPDEDAWLSDHYEAGQTVKQYERLRKSQPSPTCNIIYIQPFGDFNGPRSPNLNIICDFSHIFFPGCQTEILPSVEFDSKTKQRINQYTKQPQYFVPNIMNQLKKMQRKRHKREELFSIGVTMVDIYPNPNWNFVYGEASIDEGIAIYSFARFDPLFPHTSIESYTNEEQVLVLRRAVSTYIHEVMHLFGFEHCIYYLCLMNGTNCENEMDGQLLYLCPICLKKLYVLFRKQNFNILHMYQNLLELSRKIGFQQETIWYENRLRLLNQDL